MFGGGVMGQHAGLVRDLLAEVAARWAAASRCRADPNLGPGVMLPLAPGGELVLQAVELTSLAQVM